AFDGRRLAVLLLPAAVVTGRLEALPDQLGDTHARPRIARRRVAPVGLLGVLAQCELDALGRAHEDQVVRPAAPPPLRDLRLAADRVGRAVQDVRDGRAAGELAVDRDVERVEDVPDADLRRHVVRALVDVAVDGRVRVRVDDAGRDVHAMSVDLDGPRRRRHALPDRHDLAARDDEVRVLEDPGGALRPDRRAADDHGRGSRDGSGLARGSGADIRSGRLQGLRGGLLRLLALRRRGERLDAYAVDPDLRDARLLGERLAGRDDQARDLARLERPEPVRQPELSRRNGRDRGERGLSRQPARDPLPATPPAA